VTTVCIRRAPRAPPRRRLGPRARRAHRHRHPSPADRSSATASASATGAHVGARESGWRRARRPSRRSRRLRRRDRPSAPGDRPRNDLRDVPTRIGKRSRRAPQFRPSSARFARRLAEPDAGVKNDPRRLDARRDRELGALREESGPRRTHRRRAGSTCRRGAPRACASSSSQRPAQRRARHLWVVSKRAHVVHEARAGIDGARATAAFEVSIESAHRPPPREAPRSQARRAAAPPPRQPAQPGHSHIIIYARRLLSRRILSIIALISSVTNAPRASR